MEAAAAAGSTAAAGAGLLGAGDGGGGAGRREGAGNATGAPLSRPGSAAAAIRGLAATTISFPELLRVTGAPRLINTIR